METCHINCDTLPRSTMGNGALLMNLIALISDKMPKQ